MSFRRVFISSPSSNDLSNFGKSCGDRALTMSFRRFFISSSSQTIFQILGGLRVLFLKFETLYRKE